MTTGRLTGDQVDAVLGPSSVVLGRKRDKSSNATYVLLKDDPTVSRFHAEVKLNRDLGRFELYVHGKNGVSVDGDLKVEGSKPTPLSDGTVLQVGKRRLTVHLDKTGTNGKRHKMEDEDDEEDEDDQAELVIDEDSDEDGDNGDSRKGTKRKRDDKEKGKRDKRGRKEDATPKRRGKDAGNGARTPKRRGQAASAKRYTPVPRDEFGKPILPIVIGSLAIVELGTVVYDRPKFHAKNYIWPVGFKSTRSYPSTKDPNIKCNYTSEIVDGESGPLFTVTPEDSDTITAATASGAWTEVVKTVNSMRAEQTGKRLFTTVSGPEMFGFSHPTISKLIQELPNADKCEGYVFQNFVVRDASVPNSTYLSSTTTTPTTKAKTEKAAAPTESTKAPPVKEEEEDDDEIEELDDDEDDDEDSDAA